MRELEDWMEAFSRYLQPKRTLLLLLVLKSGDGGEREIAADIVHFIRPIAMSRVKHRWYAVHRTFKYCRRALFRLRRKFRWILPLRRMWRLRRIIRAHRRAHAATRKHMINVKRGRDRSKGIKPPPFKFIAENPLSVRA